MNDERTFTKEEAIQHVCETVAAAYHAIHDYTTASDGFCQLCAKLHGVSSYDNRGSALEYTRRAVLLQLRRDGLPVPEFVGNESTETYLEAPSDTPEGTDVPAEG